MESKKNGQLIIIGVLAVAILFMSVGFAAYAQNLNIDGSVTVSAVKWSVHWVSNSLQVQADSVELTTSSVTDDQVSFSATLTKPGDKVHFKVTAINDGDFDAILNQITMTALTAAQQEYLTYTIKYAGNTYTATTANNLNISLPASSSNTAEVEVTAAYVQPDSADDLPASDVVVNLSAQFHYDQAA